MGEAKTAEANRRVNLSPRPTWVDALSPDQEAKPPEGSSSEGSFFLLADTQVNVAKEAEFSHYAIKILSEAGVQSSSSVEAEWDPSFQRLDFHYLRVIRGEEVQDRLKAESFRVIQREQNLESHMFDGSLSAVLFLDDVRKGDVIEYAYSVTGRNPVFGGSFSESKQLAFGVPVARLRHRVLHPLSRPLRIMTFPAELEARRSVLGGEESIVWDLSGLKAVLTEEGMPSWYEPFAYSQQSEYGSWREVAGWALGVFGPRMKAGAGVKSLAAEFQATSSSREAAILAAIRFVQDEIRYLGIEIGAYSHTPNDPETVLKRRYGDCKDKALLLAVLLREMGVEASSALVSTESGPALDERLPSPYAFNHAVTALVLDGKRIWVDPTISCQRGSLSALAFPDYRRALLVEAGTAGLSEIPVPAPGSLSVKEDFSLATQTGQKDGLVVTTVFEGSRADDMRYRFSGESREAMAKDYLDYYSGRYPGIARSADLEFVDDEDADRITLVERYSLELGGKPGERDRADFRAGDIASYLSLPDNRERTAPYALDGPAKVSQAVIVHPLPDYRYKKDSVAVEAQEFSFAYSSDYGNDSLALSWNLDLRAESVAADRIGAYYAKADEALDYADYGISFSSGAEPDFDYEFLVLLALAALFAAVSGFLFSLRGNALPSPSFLSPRSRLGAAFGGKAEGFATKAGFAFQAAALAFLVLDALLSRAARPGALAALVADGPSSPDAALGYFLLGEGALQAAIAGLCAVGLFLHFLKRREAPALYGLQAAYFLPVALADLCVVLATGEFDAGAIFRKSALLAIAAAQAAVALALMLSGGAKGFFRYSGPLFGFEVRAAPESSPIASPRGEEGEGRPPS